MEQKKKDTYYFDIAKVVASRSTCLFGNVGCVIVDFDDNVISTGYLADKSDILNCKRSGLCSYVKRENISADFGIPEHCDYMFPEVSAILSAERSRLKGATLYVYAYDTEKEKTVSVKLDKTLSKIILASGIKRIVMSADQRELISDDTDS